MKNKTWKVNLNGKETKIKLQHGYWSGKRIIEVDDQIIEETKKFIDSGSEHRFVINEHKCILRIRPGTLGGLFGFEYDLFVDGLLK